ncbi:MAG: fused MFS/spermidine synthase [Cyclobacteriaceae bacterium]|nr:fused MFS/spermidine synthase [Cyclobacteriaceae bacterium]
MSKARKLLSYLSGVIVEKRPSAVSGELEVWYQNSKHVLHSPDANYSFDTLHRVFQKAFKKFDIKKRNPKSVLILGFGAGSVATILCDELNLTPHITGVELDPEVIALAKKYFNLDRFSSLTIHVADAAEFISHENTQYDLLVSDVFVDKNLPDHLIQQAYIENLIRLTAKKGIGMMNVISETKAQRGNLEKLIMWFNEQGIETEIFRVSAINQIVAWHR